MNDQTNDQTNTTRLATGQAQLSAIKEATRILREAFGGNTSMVLNLSEGYQRFSNHSCKTYAQATNWLRSIGCGDREKQVYDTYTALQGLVDGIGVIAYPDELPPTCRKVKKIERIPKTQTVETGEFIEVTREVIECGNEVAL